jgi:hypothetical protein
MKLKLNGWLAKGQPTPTSAFQAKQKPQKDMRAYSLKKTVLVHESPPHTVFDTRKMSMFSKRLLF